MGPHRELSYRVIDQFAEAVLLGRLPDDGIPEHQPILLGPLLEFRQLSRQQSAIRSADRSWIANSDCGLLLSKLEDQNHMWSSITGRKTGFMRVDHAAKNLDDWTGFAQQAKRAAVSSGLTSDLAAQIVAALDELLDNVIQHSKLSSSGVAAFAEGDGWFEIIVADEGIGVLESLKSNEKYGDLADHSEALTYFIRDGVDLPH